MELLKCENLSFSYDNNVVVSDINFSVNKGDYVCVLGENGSGKSTLIKGLLGFIKPTCGKISFSEILEKNKIGYLPQQTNIQDEFPASVMEVVMSGTLNLCPRSPFYTKSQKELALYNMERLKISDLKNKCFRELSGGQKQKVLLARALCSASLMLLLDEPVSSLDFDSANEMYDIIKKLNDDGITIIMITHDIENAVKNSNYILHLHTKQIYFGKSENYNRKDLF